MRSTLWSRAARPKVNGTCTTTTRPSCITSRGSVARQTTSGPARRHITVNDVFTLLLTPVLATALLADTSWKDKRRKDWAHKIAEIEAETAQIQTRTTQSWQTLQHRSLRLGAAQQRRQYSAVALRSLPEDEADLLLNPSVIQDQQLAMEEGTHQQAQSKGKSTELQRSDTFASTSRDESATNFTPHDLEKSERLRRLLAIKLALNLTIYLNTGVSANKVRKEIRLPNITPDLKYDPREIEDLPRLLHRMRDLCSMVWHLKQTLPDGATPIRKESLTEDSQRLQNEICALSERYEASSITMPEFVTSYTLAVLKSTGSPTSKAYLSLFRGFARGSSGDMPSHDLAMQTLYAWEQSKLPIDDAALFLILGELARLKHVQKFDGLMRDLTMSPSPLNAVGRWTWERANDIQVPVPRSYNPALLSTLIHCALRFDQPQKAEAWSNILRRTWKTVNDPARTTPVQQVFTNWMRYYEVQGNWRHGVGWLDAAQKWMFTVASFDVYSLQRLTIGMLSLCFACGKSREYEEILSAAVESGLPSLSPSHFLGRSSRIAICKEWDHLYHESRNTKSDTRTEEERIQAFQEKVGNVVQRQSPENAGASLQWRRRHEHMPNPLMANLGLPEPNQVSVQAVPPSQKTRTNEQADLLQTKATARWLQKHYNLKVQRVRSLESELAKQKMLVREMAAHSTKPQSVNSMDLKVQESSGTKDIGPSQLSQVEHVDLFRPSLDASKTLDMPNSQPRRAGDGPVIKITTCSTSPSIQKRHVTQQGPGRRILNNLAFSPSERGAMSQYREPERAFSRPSFLESHLVKS